MKDSNTPLLMILPTEDILADFLVDVRTMTNHDYDMAEITKDIFKAMEFRPNVDDAIITACDTIIRLFDMSNSIDDGKILAGGFANMAKSMKEVLAKADAWDSSGLLRVKYHSAIANDWVVKVVDDDTLKFNRWAVDIRGYGPNDDNGLLGGMTKEGLVRLDQSLCRIYKEAADRWISTGTGYSRRVANHVKTFATVK